MKTVGTILGLLVALASGVSIWYATLGPGGAAGRIEAGRAEPRDFSALCAKAVSLKASTQPSWSGAEVAASAIRVDRPQRPQEITCAAQLRDGTRVVFQARIFCGAGADCVNVM